MDVPVRHTIDGLARDLRSVPRVADREFNKAARDAAQKGNRVAKASARKNSGTHGKHYHKAFRPEKRGNAHYQFGPISAMPQGGMSFEEGSRNQPPHGDLAKGAAAAGAQLPVDVRNALNRALGQVF